MKLGDSLRRRRKGVTRSPGADAADPPGRFPLLDNLWAVLALGLALAVVGSTIGYLVGTRALFPAPQGPTDLVEVPELSGLTADSALLALADGGLTLGSVDTIRHPEVPIGLTLGQSPLAGQLALPGDSIRIVVSAGPEERPVPDLVGIRGDRARDVLDAAGFTVLEDTVQSDLPAGVVVRLEPRPGTSLALPAEVSISLSLGPPLVEVPLLVGLSEEEARVVADSVGLVVGEVLERFRFGLDQGTVIEQQPAARQMVERGSEIRLVVGRRGTGDARPQVQDDGSVQEPSPRNTNPLEGTRPRP
jgi:beta-lactam-binding protein with PASTA domain